MNGPFTRDVSKLDSVAQTVVKMREKPTEQLDELDKKTLKSYKKQALGLSFDRLQRNRDSSYIAGNKKGVEGADRKMHNRAKGHKLASEKLAKMTKK
jgi:hypothetical protein